MRKEVILAIIFGGLIGGIILFGINLANNSVKNLPTTQNPTATPTADIVTPTPTPEKKEPISIVTPEDESVVFQPEITIKGSTTPNTDVILITESDEEILTSDSNGLFSLNTKLIPGENVISASIISPDQIATTVNLTVIYTSTPIEP